ncbi:hypothetical protein CCP2SC5_970003 [Azospirillaceae bacterium]
MSKILPLLIVAIMLCAPWQVLALGGAPLPLLAHQAENTSSPAVSGGQSLQVAAVECESALNPTFQALTGSLTTTNEQFKRMQADLGRIDKRAMQARNLGWVVLALLVSLMSVKVLQFIGVIRVAPLFGNERLMEAKIRNVRKRQATLMNVLEKLNESFEVRVQQNSDIGVTLSEIKTELESLNKATNALEK